MMHGTREVEIRHSRCDAGEQRERSARGAGGARRRPRGCGWHGVETQSRLAGHGRWPACGKACAVRTRVGGGGGPYEESRHVRFCAGRSVMSVPTVSFCEVSGQVFGGKRRQR